MIPKFRAWLKDAKEMVDVIEIDLYNEEIFYIYNDYENQEQIRLWAKFDDIELMQSTGLKDKNGVEIYEGDITQSTWYDVGNNPYKKKGEITFVGAQYVIAYDSQFDVETGEITYDAHSLTYAEDVEVIGNIYENQELLEEIEE